MVIIPIESTGFSKIFKCNFKVWFTRIKDDYKEVIMEDKTEKRGKAENTAAGTGGSKRCIYTSIQNKDQETIMKMLQARKTS